MSRWVTLLVLAWLGAGPALAQDGSAADAAAGPADPATSSTDISPDGSEGPESSPPGSTAAADAPPGAVGAAAAVGDGTPTGSTPAASGGAEGAAGARSSERVSPDEEFERLFGAEPPEALLPSTDQQVQDMNLPDTPGWIWPVGFALLALLLALRWQLNRTVEAPARIRVVQRIMLGREGNLAVVELGEDNDRRRLLVGYGGGAPRLVAELDAPDPALTPPVADSDTASRRWARAVSRAVAPTRSAPAEAPRTPEEVRLRPRRSLIAEVLAERDPSDRDASERPATGSSDGPSAEPPTAPVTSVPPRPSSGVALEPTTGEDDEPSETYTFRGLIG